MAKYDFMKNKNLDSHNLNIDDDLRSTHVNAR